MRYPTTIEYDGDFILATVTAPFGAHLETVRASARKAIRKELRANGYEVDEIDIETTWGDSHSCTDRSHVFVYAHRYRNTDTEGEPC